jgi:hypothetical protein
MQKKTLDNLLRVCYARVNERKGEPMIPTPVEVAYNSNARFWCLTFELDGFLMYLCYDDVNNYRSLQEWGTK